MNTIQKVHAVLLVLACSAMAINASESARPASCLISTSLTSTEKSNLQNLVEFYYTGERLSPYLAERQPDGSFKNLLMLDQDRAVTEQVRTIIEQTYEACLSEEGRAAFRGSLTKAYAGFRPDDKSDCTDYLLKECAGGLSPAKLLLSTVTGEAAAYTSWWKYMMTYNNSGPKKKIGTLFIYLWGVLLHRFVPEYMDACGSTGTSGGGFREELAVRWADLYSNGATRTGFMNNLRILAYAARDFIGLPAPCGIFLLFKQAIRLMLADLKKYSLPATTTQESIEDELFQAIGEDEFLQRCWHIATEPERKAMPLFMDGSLSLTDGSTKK